jgi:ribosomal protein S18 acetylase RimI-like enzyme
MLLQSILFARGPAVMYASAGMNTTNPTTIHIREATVDDAAAIVRLIRQLGDEAEITEDYVPQYLAGAERDVLLAERAGSIKGLLSYSARADLYHAGNSILIEELVVDETCRGQGVGGALLESLFEQLAVLNCRELCLAVMPDNEAAIRFYRRHGLVEEALFLERHFK